MINGFMIKWLMVFGYCPPINNNDTTRYFLFQRHRNCSIICLVNTQLRYELPILNFNFIKIVKNLGQNLQNDNVLLLFVIKCKKILSLYF